MIRGAMIVGLATIALTSGMLVILTEIAPLWWSRWSDESFVQVYVAHGILEVEYGRAEDATSSPTVTTYGFAIGYWRARYGAHEFSLRLWPICLLAATYPTLCFTRGPLRRYYRSKRGLCLSCGYSLTGNVSGTCPECGRRVQLSVARFLRKALARRRVARRTGQDAMRQDGIRCGSYSIV